MCRISASHRPPSLLSLWPARHSHSKSFTKHTHGGSGNNPGASVLTGPPSDLFIGQHTTLKCLTLGSIETTNHVASGFFQALEKSITFPISLTRNLDVRHRSSKILAHLYIIVEEFLNARNITQHHGHMSTQAPGEVNAVYEIGMHGGMSTTGWHCHIKKNKRRHIYCMYSDAFSWVLHWTLKEQKPTVHPGY